MYWKGLTTRGASWGGGSGLVLALVLVIMAPTVWVDALGNKEAIIPIKNPALFSVSLAFIVCWFVSITDKSAQAAKEKELFDDQNVRAQTGLGIHVSGSH